MKKNIDIKKALTDLSLIVLGDLLLAVAIVVFLEPERLVTGGVSGLSIIAADYSQRFFGFTIPLWLTNLVLNIPLFIAGLKAMEREFLFKTLFAAAFLSVALYIASLLPKLSGDILLAALFGGVVCGAGLGLVFCSAATTGGSDLAAGILHRHIFRHYSIARILFVLDAAVIALGLLAFGPIRTMYAVVAVFVSSKVTDAILDGLSFAKAAFIISDSSDDIAGAVISRLQRGVTGLNGRGMFTKKERGVLLCVVSKKELVKLKAIVRELDERAFVIVADVREVMGEGFRAV